MSKVGSSITFSALTSQKNSNSGYTIVISIAILFLITLITLIFYLYICSRSAASPPRPQTEEDVETGLDETTLKTWPKLTYAEAKHLDPRAAAIGCCLVCLVDFEEEEEEEEDDDDKVLRLLPECGHLFHAICLDSWLRRQPTCPVCRSSAVNMLTPLAEVVPLAIVRT